LKEERPQSLNGCRVKEWEIVKQKTSEQQQQICNSSVPASLHPSAFESSHLYKPLSLATFLLYPQLTDELPDPAMQVGSVRLGTCGKPYGNPRTVAQPLLIRSRYVDRQFEQWHFCLERKRIHSEITTAQLRQRR
jgi:hypothetical protein